MRQDLTGQRFGRLMVCCEIEKIQSNKKRHYWLCRCDCGNEKVVEESHLKTGHTKSCGCYRRELPMKRWVDLTGRKFGRLTVLSKLERTENTEEYWECICSCGRHVVVSKENLCAGKTKSCGCLQEETRKENMKKAIHFVDGTCLEKITNPKNTASNTSGYRGVYKRENSKWRAAIGFQGKVHNLGTFTRIEDAAQTGRRGTVQAISAGICRKEPRVRNAG